MSKPNTPQLLMERGIVAEMVAQLSDLKIDVPTASGVNMEELVAGDSDPLFVIVEALNPQISRNKNNWTEEAMEDVARQINSIRPDAYEGHLKDEDRATVAPKATTIWIGAKIIEVDGIKRLFIKGYVMPYASERKAYLRAAKAAGKKASVSVYGEVSKQWDKIKKAWNILDFKLESVDWSRPGAEGVPGTGFMQLAKEMKGDTMERNEIIQSTTLQEMAELNPDVVNEAKEQGKEEVRQEVETAAQEKVDKAETEKKAIEDVLPEGAKTPETISEMVNDHRELVEEHIDKQLESRIASKGVRQVVRQSVMKEMAGKFATKKLADSTIDSVLELPETKSIMQEMAKPNVPNPGEDNRHSDSGSRFVSVK